MNATHLTDDQSTLVRVMAWYRQATSHHLSQCWPRSLSPYGVTRPQWVNTIRTDCALYQDGVRLRKLGSQALHWFIFYQKCRFIILDHFKDFFIPNRCKMGETAYEVLESSTILKPELDVCHTAQSVLKNPHIRRPIAHSRGCLLWVHTLIYVCPSNWSAVWHIVLYWTAL